MAAIAGASSLARAERLVAFLNRSPSPFHAVEAVRAMLTAGGFVEVCQAVPKEREREREGEGGVCAILVPA
jgi:aspartyl aminopeptidase